MPPSLAGAILLLARQVAPSWEGWPQTQSELLTLVGAKKSQAYELLGRLWQVLPSLLGKAGRPSAVSAECSCRWSVLETLFAYLCDHPGAVCGQGRRRTYSDGFRRLVVGLLDPGKPGEGMTVAELASVSQVPLGTLKDWLRTEPPEEPQEDDPSENAATTEEANSSGCSVLDGIRSIHVRLMVTLWLAWKGTFSDFCHAVRTEHRLPLGMTRIGDLLEILGLRPRKPRRFKQQACWSRGTFVTMFPGAQWLGDGTSIAVSWRDTGTGSKLVFVYNVQANHDPAADATVGFAVTKSEDEDALRQAYEAAKETTGGPPLALTLDGKPCNHSPAAQELFNDTILLRATPGRGQAKAPLEGAFGLFAQAMPPLVIQGATLEERIRCVLELVLTAWWRGRNGRPRKRLGGLTPVESYRSARPTEEERKAAKNHVRDLERRQERVLQTRAACADPVRVELLRKGLVELGISDPDDRLARNLARYGRDAIAWGLATYRTKQVRETLPPTHDPDRYLAGIIRNLDIKLELELMADYLLEQRIRLRDLTLEPLQRAADQLRAQHPPDALPQAFVDQALAAEYTVDFQFWTRTAAEALETLPAERRNTFYKPLTRRVAASFKTDRQRRTDLIHRLAQVTAAA